MVENKKKCSLFSQNVLFLIFYNYFHYGESVTGKQMALYLSQLMRFWYLSHKRPAKAQASLRIHAVSPEPLLSAHMKYGSRQGVQPKMRHLAPLDGCTCTFEE